MSARATAFALLGAFLIAVVGEVASQDQQKPKSTAKSKNNAADAQAITANVKKYTEAFNRQDVKSLLELFTDDCDITEADGTRVRGRKELEAEFKDTFANDKSAQVSVAMDSLSFITPDVALETGRVLYFPDGATLTSESEYQVSHVKRGGRWQMSHVRTFNRKVLSPYDRLRELEWLVGDWIDESSESAVETSYRWDAKKSFLLQEFTIRVKGQKVLSGSQRIGLDPQTQQIRGWVFDTEGGYAENHWASLDNGWVIKAKGVRADGKVVTATNEITRTSKDQLRFESVDRIVGDERFPGFTAIAVRKPPSPKQ
jgi:uncharacterized protein (TIGR02246 family)